MVASLINTHMQLADEALRVRSPSVIKAAAKRFRTRPRVGRTHPPNIFAVLSLFGKDNKKKNHNSSSPRNLLHPFLHLLLEQALRSALGKAFRISRLRLIPRVFLRDCVCVCAHSWSLNVASKGKH